MDGIDTSPRLDTIRTAVAIIDLARWDLDSHSEDSTAQVRMLAVVAAACAFAPAGPRSAALHRSEVRMSAECWTRRSVATALPFLTAG